MLLLLVAVVGSLTLASARPPPPNKAPRTELSHSCSRSVTREVRKQLKTEVIGLATKDGFNLSSAAACPLDPIHDLYGEHEKQKLRRKPGTPGLGWHCGICNKTFKNEHYLDLHMERKHMDVTPTVAPVCLADYCEIFENCHGESRRPRRPQNESACDAKVLAISRKRCDEAMSTCFPLDQPIPRKLHAQLSRHWCQVIDCRIREEKLRDQKDAHIPVIVWIILIIFVGFLVFCCTVTCVDNSDDVVQLFVDSGLASIGCAKRFIQAREGAKEAVGLERGRKV